MSIGPQNKDYRRRALPGGEQRNRRSHPSLGGKGFGKTIRAETEGEPERKKDKGSLAKVAEKLSKGLRISHADLRKPDRSWNRSRARTLIAHVLVKHGGFKVGDVAAYFGRDQTTISSLLSRFSQRVQQDASVQAEVKKLAQIV